MRSRVLIFILSNLAYSPAMAELPAWVKSGSASIDGHPVVLCSHEALDPQQAQEIAESKCLASAARANGVTVTVHIRTVQSLSGSDASETASIKPINALVKCSWTNRYLEELNTGYRVWLQCKIESIETNESRSPRSPAATNVKPAALPYKRGILYVTTVPKADKIIVLNKESGERVIDPSSNAGRIELREGDTAFTVRKSGYLDNTQQIPFWSHGKTVTVTVELAELPK